MMRGMAIGGAIGCWVAFLIWVIGSMGWHMGHMEATVKCMTDNVDAMSKNLATRGK